MGKGLLCLAALGVASSVSASPTGLFLVPIADILKHREVQAVLTVGGTERNVSKGYTFAGSGAVGLFDRLEVGFGTDFLGSTSYDVKLQLLESPPQIPGAALSVGVVGCSGSYREPYIVGRYDLKGFRLHGGYWNTAGEGRLFLGTDFPILDHGTGSVEVLGGHRGWAWFGFSWEFDSIPGVSLSLGLGLPADRSDGIQHSVSLVYDFRF